jgi:tRNA pseudouridine38-40 synthase
MAHYKVILAYDGTHFSGFQRQGSARTVQAVLENSLRSLGWTGRAILSAGRTDRGVHALGQVIAFELDWVHSDQELLHALNASLPKDVAVQMIDQTRADFHPRYDAIERRYRYRVYTSPVRNPLFEQYAWRVWPPPQLEKLAQAAKLIEGSHDFAAFGKPSKPAGSTTRFIYEAGWQIAGSEMVFNVRGNAFLYHMVRRLAYTQVQVGLGRVSLAQFEQAVRQVRALPPGLSPAHGLTLMEVRHAESRQEAERWMMSLL